MRTGTSWRRASIGEPRALTASTVAFIASWRDSNCAVRADNHKNKKTIKIKIMNIRVKSLHGVHFTHHRGVGFGQPCSDGAGLLFSRVKGGLRDPEANLQLVILPRRLGIAILSHPPLMKAASGIIAIVGVGRIRRRGQHRRCSVRRLAGPGKGTKTVIHNKPIGESE